MIKKPSNYDAIEVVDNSFERFKLGGHKCIIMSVEEYKSPNSGKTSLKIYFDTDKTDSQPSYFAEVYRRDTRPEKTWDNRAIIYLPLGEEETQVRMFKAGITAIEKSNKFKWNWNEQELINKKVGCEFGLEEYKAQDGNIKTKTRARRLRSIDKIGEIEIEPDVKTLNNGYVPYDEYMEKRELSSQSQTTVEINPSDLPF